MPIFILTDDNIDAAKAALRTRLPAVRSAHLTEALAAGLGFQTHAALRAVLASEGSKPPAVVDATSSQFTARLPELGYADVPTPPFEDAITEKILGDTPYTFFKRGDRAANDRHFHACQARNRPMIMVRMARQYAELEWDCITIDSDCDEHVQRVRQQQARAHHVRRVSVTRQRRARQADLLRQGIYRHGHQAPARHRATARRGLFQAAVPAVTRPTQQKTTRSLGLVQAVTAWLGRSLPFPIAFELIGEFENRQGRMDDGQDVIDLLGSRLMTLMDYVVPDRTQLVCAFDERTGFAIKMA